MDNLCHTLVGAALGEAGLKRRTRLGMATLLIGANLPDVDGIAVFGSHGLDFRRGWTHGVLALALWPFILVGVMRLWDRISARASSPRTPVHSRQLFLLATVSIFTHPTLDFMNSYGMRWLMPFSGRWFYGDALFIVDPWILLALSWGVWLSRRRESRGTVDSGPARAALVSTAVYIGLMLAGTLWGRSIVGGLPGIGPAFMVTAVPLDPFRRQVLMNDAGRYRFGVLRLLPSPVFTRSEVTIETNDQDPAARLAAATDVGREFVQWSRYPFYSIERSGDSIHVRMDDARYANGSGRSFAGRTVSVASPSPR